MIRNETNLLIKACRVMNIKYNKHITFEEAENNTYRWYNNKRYVATLNFNESKRYIKSFLPTGTSHLVYKDFYFRIE